MIKSIYSNNILRIIFENEDVSEDIMNRSFVKFMADRGITDWAWDDDNLLDEFMEYMDESLP